MFSARLLRATPKFNTRVTAFALTKPIYAVRPITCSTKLYKEDKRTPRVAERALENEDGHHGSFARTDNTVKIEHPDEESHPPSFPVSGRGGMHFKRTLASFSLEKRVCVITGGARGLGLVMSQACLLSGADVAIVDLNKDEGQRQADQLMKHFEEENPGSELHPKVTSHFCDVSDNESVKSCLGEILGDHGKVDHLVTSAGFTENFDAIAYPPDRINKLWGVDVNGTYFWACEYAKHLLNRKAKGSMVMIGSMSGAIVNVPQPQAPYNAAKAAVRHLASSLAVEWAHAGIRVNCISPGYMLTALTAKILEDNPELYKHWTSLIPTGHMGQPEDLMGAVVYLLSDASGYVTGADLRVDGGYTTT